jgi:hypothetical protein
MPLEYFIRGSDNQVKLTLTEDGLPVAGAWTSLDIWIGDDVQITRANDGDGVTLSTTTGILTISPADLTAPEIAELAELSTLKLYRVRIVVTSGLNDGAVFGGPGSDAILFRIGDKPA